MAVALSSSVSSKTGPILRQELLSLTDAVAHRIRHLLWQHQRPFLNLIVKHCGCNGLSCTLNYAYEKCKFDKLVEDKGMKVLIEPRAQVYVVGTKMDFVDDKLTCNRTGYIVKGYFHPPGGWCRLIFNRSD